MSIAGPRGRRLVWALAVLLPVHTGCQQNVKCNGFLQPDASKPVETGKTATLTIDVANPADEPVTFTWRAERGSVIAPSLRARSAIYKAPEVAGEDTITVQVLRDKTIADEKSIKLTICRPQTIRLRADQFFRQKDEVMLNTQSNAVAGLRQQDGLDLSDYDLQITFLGGDGQSAQLFYKDKTWKNVYSFPFSIKSNQPLRFNPHVDACQVREFNDFTHIYGIGARLYGAANEARIVSAKLSNRQEGCAENNSK